MKDLLDQTVRAVAMTETEKKQYESLGEKIYNYDAQDGERYYLRSSYYGLCKYSSGREENHFILYRNGLDITIDRRKLTSSGIPMEGYTLNCDDGYKTKVYEVRRCPNCMGQILKEDTQHRNNYGYGYYRTCDYWGNRELCMPKEAQGNVNWFYVYEVELTLDELERFNVNYQIMSIWQKMGLGIK